MALPHFEGIEFDVLLTFNGSYCFAGEETIYSNCLRPEDIETIRRNAAAMNRPIAVATKNRMAASGTEPDLEYYHLDRSQAMAFGDGNSDIEMLEAVGTGVAMANGSDDLKAVADEICGDVTEDGIYHYCLQKGLI